MRSSVGPDRGKRFVLSSRNVHRSLRDVCNKIPNLGRIHSRIRMTTHPQYKQETGMQKTGAVTVQKGTTLEQSTQVGLELGWKPA